MPIIKKTIHYVKKRYPIYNDYGCRAGYRYKLVPGSPSSGNYKAGWRAEHKAIEQLKAYGYLVIRSAKSGGPFDLVAFNETQFVLVQVKLCKHGKLLSYNKTKEEIRNIAVPINCKKELWVYERRCGWHHFSL